MTTRLDSSQAWIPWLPSAVVLALGAAACSRDAEVPVAQRLVDVFSAEMVDGSPDVNVDPAALAEWRFDGEAHDSESPATHGWEAFRDVTGLEVRDGRLAGAVTSATAIVRLPEVAELDEDDLLHEIQVRIRATAGTLASLHLVGSEPSESDLAVLENQAIPWLMTAPIEAGDALVTCAFKSPLPLRGTDIGQILLRPTDAAGASFEVESVRLVFRREHLAQIPSGIAWQGLSDHHRETVVARAPETVRWQLTLPERPLLDLALGTLDGAPVTFAVALAMPGGDRRLFERTVSTPRRWDEARIDLADFAGLRVTLELALEAETAGALGLWGSPEVRRAGALPRAAEAGEEPPQGVVFILADTLRPDRLDAYGHERSTAPAVARLASEGARFNDAVAQGTWTKASAPAIVSSRYVTSHGVRDFPDRLPSSATTLAEVFRNAGYSTLGFSSVPFTGTLNGLHQGYEQMVENFDTSAKTARGFVDQLLPWLDRHRELPFFVFLHVFDPHSPFQPRSPWDALWPPSGWHRQHLDDQERLKPFIQHPLLRLSTMAQREELVAAGLDPEVFLRRQLDWYDGSIRGMDVEIQRVLERLRELGLDRRTMVVFASDHGEEFLDHGGSFHGHSVYGELTRVPLILRYPGKVPAGVSIDETVQMIDLMPTLLELSGLPAPDGLQGQSAVPLLAASSDRSSDGRWQPRPAISEKAAVQSPLIPPPIDVEATSIIFDGWKLIHTRRRPADGNDGAPPPAGPGEGGPPPGPQAGPLPPEYQLFDHRQDPLDQHDLASDHPEVVERLAGLLEGWRKSAESQKLASDEVATEDMNPEELERLRALGYVQ